MNATVFLPTLNRIKLLKRFLESYTETLATIKVLVLVDKHDFSENSIGYGSLELPQNCSIVVTGDNVSMGDKVRSVLSLAEDEDWVGLLNDDHVCITPEWDKKVDALIDGTNMVSTNDGFWNFGINPVGLTAWSLPLLKASGIPIFPRKLQHWFIDDLWKAVGESTGCWLETMKVNIAHKHVFKGEMAIDDTYNKIQNMEQISKSRKEFEDFMKEDFKDVCAKIMAFRQKQTLKEKFV